MEPNPSISFLRQYAAEPDTDRQVKALLALLNASATSSDVGKTHKEAAAITATSEERNCERPVSKKSYRGTRF